LEVAGPEEAAGAAEKTRTPGQGHGDLDAASCLSLA